MNLKPINELADDKYIHQLINLLPYGEEYKSKLKWEHKQLTVNTNFIVIYSSVCKEIVIDLVNIESNPYGIVKKLIEWGFYKD